jgi:hypothetical protein
MCQSQQIHKPPSCLQPNQLRSVVADDYQPGIHWLNTPAPFAALQTLFNPSAFTPPPQYRFRESRPLVWFVAKLAIQLKKVNPLDRNTPLE